MENDVPELTLQIDDEVFVRFSLAKLWHHAESHPEGIGVTINDGQDEIEFFLGHDKALELKEWLTTHVLTPMH